jgi:hypothetical protein
VTERSICPCSVVRTIGTAEFLSSIHPKTPTAASRAHGRTTEALRSPRGCPKAHTQLLTSWPAHTRAASKGQSPPCAAPSESVKAVKDRAKMQTKCQIRSALASKPHPAGQERQGDRHPCDRAAPRSIAFVKIGVTTSPCGVQDLWRCVRTPSSS